MPDALVCVYELPAPTFPVGIVKQHKVMKMARKTEYIRELVYSLQDAQDQAMELPVSNAEAHEIVKMIGAALVAAKQLGVTYTPDVDLDY